MWLIDWGVGSGTGAVRAELGGVRGLQLGSGDPVLTVKLQYSVL